MVDQIVIDQSLYFLLHHLEMKMKMALRLGNRLVFQAFILIPIMAHPIEHVKKTDRSYPFSTSNSSHKIQATRNGKN